MINQAISWYEDDFCYYMRKPHGIASSFGRWPCFLDIIQNHNNIHDVALKTVATRLVEEFGQQGEYWLLNRLDNDTSGLLYFAKTQEIKENRRTLQKQWAITKYYIADVSGNVFWEQKLIAYPIIHHPQAKDRMICVLDSANKSHKNTKLLYCETRAEKLYYDEVNNYSCLLISIQKWVRHQIRCHLAAIWSPIIGEKLYKKKKDVGNLHLRSIWVKI